jgi:DNA-binding transcriptional LysR family regulator
VRGGGLGGHDVIAFEAGIREWRSGEIGGEPLRDARVVLRTNSAFTLLEAVALGLGIGTLPCCLADRDPRLRRGFPDAPVELDDVWLVVHPDVQRTSRVRAVIEALDARLESAAAELAGAVPTMVSRS